MTQDTGNLRQFRSVVCREYTLPRDDPASQERWIHENWACMTSHNQFSIRQTWGLKFESGLWVKIILNLGSEYLLELTNT